MPILGLALGLRKIGRGVEYRTSLVDVGQLHRASGSGRMSQRDSTTAATCSLRLLPHTIIASVHFNPCLLENKLTL